jgi:hypothetical protein
MLQTLYRTATPTDSTVDAEFYELFLDSKVINGRRVFFVKEKHGWWDEAEKRTVWLVNTLCPEEGLSTYDEAADMYDKQVRKRVSDGFPHSFSPDYYGDNPRGFLYRNLAKA